LHCPLQTAEKVAPVLNSSSKRKAEKPPSLNPFLIFTGGQWEKEKKSHFSSLLSIRVGTATPRIPSAEMQASHSMPFQ